MNAQPAEDKAKEITNHTESREEGSVCANRVASDTVLIYSAYRPLQPVQIAQTASLAPSLVETSLPRTRHLPRPRWRLAYRGLFVIDAALQQSKLAAAMALDIFVVEFGR